MACAEVVKRHRRWSGKAAWLVALTWMATSPVAVAQVGLPMTPADKLHRLDVMLKVSAARCQASGSDLRADYVAFSRNHRFALAQAGHDVRRQLAAHEGARAADRTYEQLNFRLADEYRQHHPWLDCQKLKVATQGLAVVEGDATLIEAADQILPDGAARHLAAMHRN